jgi:hypothetical protein
LQTAAIVVHADRPTVLMGEAARLSGGLRPTPPEHGAKRLHVRGWASPADAFRWTVRSPEAAGYLVTALATGRAAHIRLSAEGQALEHPVDGPWDRLELGTLQLPAGDSQLTLRAPRPGEGLELYALELVTPELAAELKRRAAALRSDTTWMRQGGYGVQFHWTSLSQPRHGPRLPYAAAVEAFDVAAFADMVAQTGAGHVILTTSHAEHYFPAPIAAIDRVLPGRTTRRDLVADLIGALQRCGVRLILYYHPGHDDWADPRGWWRATGFDPSRPQAFLDHWCAIVREVGERYGPGLAGWFFDDGCVYYPLNPDFERMAQAAKAGHPDRVICYNPWVWPRFTDFQDYFCGEGWRWLEAADQLPADGSGIFLSGPQRGLQAHANFILESNWWHGAAETPIAPPAMDLEGFLQRMLAAIRRGVVPSVNLEIYQDGGVSADSLAYLAALRAALRTERARGGGSVAR